MPAHTRQALETKRQFRKALALNLITEAVPASYDLLKMTVQQGISMGQKGLPINRQQIDAAKALISMAGLSEPPKDLDDKDTSRMSLAELESMIKDLRVIDNAAPEPQPSEQPIDIFS